MNSFALAMSFVSLAIIDIERQKLETIVVWHLGKLDDNGAADLFELADSLHIPSVLHGFRDGKFTDEQLANERRC